MSGVTPISPFASAKLGPITLRNRVIKSATFEGVVPDSLVTQELIDYHRKVAAGGTGMNTVAYLAVSPDGQTTVSGSRDGTIKVWDSGAFWASTRLSAA